MSSRPNNNNKHPINRQIRASRVRLIYEDINTILTLDEALRFAADRELDLVQFSQGDCPTCRVIDYSKFKYHEEKKRKQEAASKPSMKEIQLKASISDNDLQVKEKQLIGFLDKGHDVRLRIKLRGRERINADKHGIFLIQFANKFADVARIEYKAGPDGAPIGGVIALKPTKTKANP